MKYDLIAPDVKYIGVDDLDIDLFEGQYDVPLGVSYNSYLIEDEKVAIMDTVDATKTQEWEQNLEKALDGKTPDYLIVQHLEPDHGGSVQYIMEKYPQMIAVCSQKAVAMFKRFFEKDFSDRIQVVKEGETLSLGQHTLQFFMAPMVHWPEVMVTYDQQAKILFSADGFGKFGALCKEEEDDEGWACEARRYYFNIVGKYGAMVQNLLKKVATLDIQQICPQRTWATTSVFMTHGASMSLRMRAYSLPTARCMATRQRQRSSWQTSSKKRAMSRCPPLTLPVMTSMRLWKMPSVMTVWCSVLPLTMVVSCPSWKTSSTISVSRPTRTARWPSWRTVHGLQLQARRCVNRWRR